MKNFTLKVATLALFIVSGSFSAGLAQGKASKPAKTADRQATMKAAEQSAAKKQAPSPEAHAAINEHDPQTYFFLLAEEKPDYKEQFVAVEKFASQINGASAGRVEETPGLFFVRLPNLDMVKAFKAHFNSLCIFSFYELVTLQAMFKEDIGEIKKYIN